MAPTKITAKKTARWFLGADALRINGLKALEDGTVTIPIEVVRPGQVNAFEVMPELINALAAQPGADLVDDHEADIDGKATHIGGAIEHPFIEQGTGALMAQLRTFDTPLGKDFAGLIKEHVKSVKAGGREIVANSVGVRDVHLLEGIDPSTHEGLLPAVGGQWDHVMLTRANYQAQPNAGIRATLGDALADAFAIRGTHGHLSQKLTAAVINSTFDKNPRSQVIADMAEIGGVTTVEIETYLAGTALPTLEQLIGFSMILWLDLTDLIVAAWADGVPKNVEATDFSKAAATITKMQAHRKTPDTLKSGGSDDGSAMSDIDDLKAQLAEKNAEVEKLTAKAEKDTADQTESLTAITKERDALQTAKDDVEKATLIATIEGIHKKLDTDVPDVKREDGTKVELAEATIEEVRAVEITALRAINTNSPRKIDGVPPKGVDDDAGAEPPPLTGLFDRVKIPKNSGGGN